MAAVRGRRTRCGICNRLVEYTVAWWPHGFARRPRVWVCERCKDSHPTGTGLQARGVIT